MPTTEELAADFVVKAVSFDRDGDKSLNSAETRIMATAFIRTLG